MISRTKRQRHKYSPIHMVTASHTTSIQTPSQHDSSPTSTADKENQPPNLVLPAFHFSHSQLYDEHSTPPSQQQPSRERSPPPSHPLPVPSPPRVSSPPRQSKSAFTPLTPFTPLSFRDVHERSIKPFQQYSTPPTQQRSATQSAFFRPMPQSTPMSSISASIPSSLSSTSYRPSQFSSPLRPSQSVNREPPPPPSSYSSEKARFLRSLPYTHRYDAIVSTLETEEQAATEWSESLTAPTTPPLSPNGRVGGRRGHEGDVPATPPSVCSLSSSSVSSVGSFSSPISAALSAIMERDSVKRGRGGLEDDEILTPSPDVFPGTGVAAAGTVPSLPASIFSSVFSQRLPLPPLTAEAKQLMVQSPLRTPQAAAGSAASHRPSSSPANAFPALQPTAFTFAPPHLTTSTSALGEWKGVIHMSEDRLYNATPTQSSASSSPVSTSWISPSPFLSQASAASATSTIVPSSNSDTDADIPHLKSVGAEKEDDEEEEEQRELIMQAEAEQANSEEPTEGTPLQPPQFDGDSQHSEKQYANKKQASVEMFDDSVDQPTKRRRSLRSSVKVQAPIADKQTAMASERECEPVSSGKKRRQVSRSRRTSDSLSPSITSGPASETTNHAAAAVTEDMTAAVSDGEPKRRRSARKVSAVLSQPEETVSATQPAFVAIADTRAPRKRSRTSLTPPSSAATISPPPTPALSSTQPDLSLSQRSQRTSRSAVSATWQCAWCTWESVLAHMSCDMCSKARASRPDAVVEVEVKCGGRQRRGRNSNRARSSQSDVVLPATEEVERRKEEQSQESERSTDGGSGTNGAGGGSTKQPIDTDSTPVSQQLLDTPASSSTSSQPADSSLTNLSQPITASPSLTHSPTLSPATPFADTSAAVQAAEAEDELQQSVTVHRGRRRRRW